MSPLYNSQVMKTEYLDFGRISFYLVYMMKYVMKTQYSCTENDLQMTIKASLQGRNRWQSANVRGALFYPSKTVALWFG